MRINRDTHRRNFLRALLFVAMATAAVAESEPALAYVGPGAGISMIGALWAVIAAVFFAVAGILIWPVRAMLRRRKKAAAQPATAEAEIGDEMGGG